MPEYGGSGGEADDQETAAQPAGHGEKPDIEQIGKQLAEWAQADNIADKVDQNRLNRLGQECCFGYEIDKRSRTEWERRSHTFMDMALQRQKDKTFPWPNASNVTWPLLSQAVNEFAAQIYPAVMSGEKVVKAMIVGTDKGQVDQAAMQLQTQQVAMAGAQQGIPPEEAAKQIQPVYIQGKEPGAKRKRADRVSEHMSWQIMREQKEWQTDSDRLFRALPILGCAARKSWFDPVWGRNCSMYVSMLDLVVNYHAKSLETAPRVTEVSELYPNEIEDRIRSGEFIRFNPGTAMTTEEQAADNKAQAYFGDRYAPHLFLEQHCFWDLDGDGYEEPYTVTIHKSSQKVVRVRARYEIDGIRLTKDKSQIAKIEPLHYYTLFQFMPNPESAIYGHGFGHILGPINESLNSSINQLFDAGTLQNLQGGFVGSGMSMHSGPLRFKMGELKPVQTGGMALRENIYMPDFKGPSIVMFQMFGLLLEAGRELAGIKAISTGAQSPASTDPQTMMAMLEQGLRVFKDVHKRVLRGLNGEFEKLFALNRKYMPQQGFKYQKADEEFEVSADDYAVTSGVESVGDPEMITDIQKLAKSQLLFQFKDDPRCNGNAIVRRIFETANLEDIDTLVPENQPPNPFSILELQLKQAELASAVTTQQKDHAQSILYLMQARKAAAEADNAQISTQIDAQLEREWISIEHTNNQLSALRLVVDAHKADAAMIKAKQKPAKKAA